MSHYLKNPSSKGKAKLVWYTERRCYRGKKKKRSRKKCMQNVSSSSSNERIEIKKLMCFHLSVSAGMRIGSELLQGLVRLHRIVRQDG